MEQFNSFPLRLRRERALRGWSQADLAERVGSDTKTVGRWENGETFPRPQYRQGLVNLFGISAEQFGLAPTSGSYRREKQLSTSPEVGESSRSVTITSSGEQGQREQKYAVREDWGEAPSPGNFYGRDQELEAIKQWIAIDGCRVVTVSGMGGIGKTALSAEVADQVKGDFQYIFWRSLQHMPSLGNILKACIQFVSDQQRVKLPGTIEDQLQLLIHHLRERRCLLIFDNLESILQPGRRLGSYQDGYQDYGRLIRRLGETQHRSCLLLTTREKPTEVTYLEGKTAPTRTLVLSGVGQAEGKAMLGEKGLVGSDEQIAALIALYAGNPLALKLIAESVQTLFAGAIGRFLEEGQVAFGNITELLEQQFHRLSNQEREILTWLAIEREPIALEEIHRDLLYPLSKAELFETLDALRRRSMIEGRDVARFTLQPVIMEYVTRHLVRRACKEFGIESSGAWTRYAFFKAQAKDYVRGSQQRQILGMIADHLLATLGKKHVAQQVMDMFSEKRGGAVRPQGYLASNALHLLIYMRYDLRGFDASHLVVRQGYFQGKALPAVNFAHAHFIDTVFSDTFGSILSIVFSSDGAMLVAGTASGDIRVLRAQTGMPLFTLRGHTDGVWSLAFSPDGKFLVSGSDDETVRVWHIPTRDCIRLLRHHSGRVRAVAFSLGGAMFASGSDDRTICLWDTASGERLALLQGHSGRIWALAFGQDDRVLASGGTDQSVREWDIASRECIKLLKGHTHWVRSLAFHSGGRLLASGSNNQTICIWDAKSGTCLQTLKGHTNHVWSVAFSPDGSQLASGSEDQTIRLWDVVSARCLRTLHEHTHGVRAVAFSVDGQVLASGGDDQALRLWEVRTGHCLTALQGYSNRIWSVSFNYDGHMFASCSEDQTINIWDASTGHCLTTISEPAHGARCIAFAPNKDVLASCGEDQTVRVWSAQTGRCLKVLKGHTNWLRYVSFSPGGDFLASCGEDQVIRLWDEADGRCLQVLEGHTSWVRSLVFSPDGRSLASASDDHTLRLWGLESGRCLQILEGHSNRVRSIAFHPAGRVIASGAEDNTLRLWNVDDGRCLITLLGHTGWIMSVAFSHDGKLLASGSVDRSIRLWDGDTGDCLAVLGGHDGRLRTVVFSPTRDILLSGCDDGTIKLWDLRTFTCIRTYIGERPYEGMNIAHTEGLTDGQKAVLQILGAIESEAAQ